MYLNLLQEEHFISKLLFSWPQVSCVSGFPARGSRVVFVSYKDCVSQVGCSMFLGVVINFSFKYDILLFVVKYINRERGCMLVSIHKILFALGLLS